MLSLGRSLCWSISIVSLAVFLIVAATKPANAIPYFAHEYGFTCQKCHSIVPRLNVFGQGFRDHGYQLPGGDPDRSTFPISTKANLIYTSDPDPGIPKAVVDEVEVYLAGRAGNNTNYFVEQYLIDGGVPGATREAWINERLTSDRARVPVYLLGGSFTLPVPVDPETYRESNQHYTVYDQTVGINPFNFFDPKIGVQARVGELGRGLAIQAAALQGHDKQSGIASDGTDFMQNLQQTFGPLTLSAYRYEGRRPGISTEDRFWRQGYAAVVTSGRWESDSVLQTGNDTSFDGFGTAARSSGGFEQLRYQLSPKLFVLGRYEGTNDPTNGLTRDFVGLLGVRTGRNSRLTLEDVIEHIPQTKNIFSTQLTVGY